MKNIPQQIINSIASAVIGCRCVELLWNSFMASSGVTSYSCLASLSAHMQAPVFFIVRNVDGNLVNHSIKRIKDLFVTAYANTLNTISSM